jgi:Tfp pilus assembly protein PilF
MFTRFIAPSPVTRSANVVTPYSYLLTQFRAWIYYLRLFFWPHPLMVDFSNFGWSHSIWEPRVLLSLGLIAVILIVGWCSRKTQPLISFFTYWFFIALLPEASFIPLADAVVGYRAYLANIGPSIVITLLSLKGWTWIWSKAQRSHQPRKLLCSISYAIIAGIILTALIVSTVSRNRDWRDEVTLWSDVISKDPVNARAYMGLGTQFLHQRDYGKAQQMFEKAIQFGPRTADAYALRGYLRAIQRKTAEALSDFTTAIKLDPRSPYTFAYRGDLYNRTGELDEAIADFKRAIALHPFYNDAYFGLAMAYVGKEDIANAMTACAQLVKIDNGDRRGYDCLGTLLIDQNRFVDAVKLYEQGIAQIPEDGELWQSLGTAYQKAGRDAEANQAFAKASLLMNGVNRQAP